jgi:hypothetical protein
MSSENAMLVQLCQLVFVFGPPAAVAQIHAAFPWKPSSRFIERSLLWAKHADGLPTFGFRTEYRGGRDGLRFDFSVSDTHLAADDRAVGFPSNFLRTSAQVWGASESPSKSYVSNVLEPMIDARIDFDSVFRADDWPTLL